MPVEKRWVLPKPIDVPGDFYDAIGGHPLVAETLYRRGCQTLESAQAFLDPEAYQPAPASALPDSEIAWELLQDAIHHQKQILVWGDFDVDGQTATTILVEGLRKLGAQVRHHIPIRAEESHGITRSVLITHLDQGFDILLTCDTGITEHENIAFVRQSNIPIIVTDHHTLEDTLPPANAIVNPQRLPEEHPLRTLPGAGVAYKLIEGLYEKLNRPFNAGHFLELAALGIVADVAHLQGDTRYLLQKGLQHLRQTNRMGLQTLYQQASLNPMLLNERHIGFQIAPRLNAVGRLGDANPMVELLTTTDPGRARVLATQIEAMNAKRRFATRQVEKAAESMLQSSPEDRLAPAIVLHHPGWPGGVVGIVAARLVERYQKPVILLTGVDPIHGSARSVKGIHVNKAISDQADFLTAFGGHPMAAGLSFPAANLSAFKRRFHAAVEAQARKIAYEPEIQIDRILSLNEITPDLIDEIERLAPFGPGNPPLNFLFNDLTLVSETSVGGQGEHRQVIVEDADENRQRFIWWNSGDENLPEAQFNLVCTLSLSDYKGTPQVSAEWIDYRLSEQGKQDISRQKFTVVDLRNAANTLQEILLLIDTEPQPSVFAEGEFPGEIPGWGRLAIKPAQSLILWTIPPSQSVLRDVLRKVKPQKVIVIGVPPHPNTAQGFLNRLAGLVKFTVQHKEGNITLSELASACAAEIETTRVGLQLWAALGHIRVEFDLDMLHIQLARSGAKTSAVEIYQSIIEELFDESLAYRRIFKSGDLPSLFKSPV